MREVETYYSELYIQMNQKHKILNDGYIDITTTKLTMLLIFKKQ